MELMMKRLTDEKRKLFNLLDNIEQNYKEKEYYFNQQK